MSFKNKVVLVTGASSGIGAATAKAFAKEGADVIMVDRNNPKLAAVNEISACYGKAPLIINADVSKDEDVERIVETTIDKWGKLDVLVNNAGISRWGSIIDENFVDIHDEIIGTNLRSPMLLAMLTGPYLIRAKGNIVNVSSVAGDMPLPQIIPYGISKSGLNYFTLASASELSAHGVRVNAISPGPVYTNLLGDSNVFNNWNTYKELTLLNRISEPEEVADLVLFLASDKARSITGANYFCDNGMFLKR